MIGGRNLTQNFVDMKVYNAYHGRKRHLLRAALFLQEIVQYIGQTHSSFEKTNICSALLSCRCHTKIPPLSV